MLHIFVKDFLNSLHLSLLPRKCVFCGKSWKLLKRYSCTFAKVRGTNVQQLQKAHV